MLVLLVPEYLTWRFFQLNRDRSEVVPYMSANSNSFAVLSELQQINRAKEIGTFRAVVGSFCGPVSGIILGEQSGVREPDLSPTTKSLACSISG